jgi:hypothetical protein
MAARSALSCQRGCCERAENSTARGPLRRTRVAARASMRTGARLRQQSENPTARQCLPGVSNRGFALRSWERDESVGNPERPVAHLQVRGWRQELIEGPQRSRMIGSEWRAALRSVVWGSRLPKWARRIVRRIKFDRCGWGRDKWLKPVRNPIRWWRRPVGWRLGRRLRVVRWV